MLPSISRQLIYPLQEFFLGRPTFSYLKELEESQWHSREKIEELQLQKLRNLLTIAERHCPWHSQRIKATGIDPANCSFAEFHNLPTMTKKDAQLHGSDMVWHGVPGGAYRYTTGGSSGQPLIFYFGRKRQASDAAGRIRSRRWWGVNVGDPEVYLWGSPVELSKTDKIKTIRDKLLNQLVLNAFAMSPEQMANYLAVLQKFQPACIYGYASSVALLARYAKEHQIKLKLTRLKVVCTTGEPLFPDQRQVISEIFKVPVANEFGSRDAGFLGHENQHNQMLMMSESFIFEVLNNEGDPVPTGEIGELAITGLCSDAQPFIRYRTGDMIRLSSELDKDGRGLHALDQVIGRSTDFLVHQNGSIIHALAAIYVLRETPGVEQFKIIQHAINQFEIQVVTNNFWNNESFNTIGSKFQSRFGDGCNVDIQQVDQIAPEASGKIRQVISKVELKF